MIGGMEIVVNADAWRRKVLNGVNAAVAHPRVYVVQSAKNVSKLQWLRIQLRQTADVETHRRSFTLDFNFLIYLLNLFNRFSS